MAVVGVLFSAFLTLSL